MLLEQSVHQLVQTLHRVSVCLPSGMPASTEQALAALVEGSQVHGLGAFKDPMALVSTQELGSRPLLHPLLAPLPPLFAQ